MKSIALAVAAMSVLFLNSCVTYHVSAQSLVEQFAGVRQETKVNIVLAPPFFFPVAVDGNSLRNITVLDKNDKKHTLPVTRHMGIKITQNSGKKTTFYFDTLLLKDSTITGNKTHFFRSHIKPILFANINKIELQK